MKFIYNSKEYETLELYDVNGISMEGMFVVFEIQYASYEKRGKRVLHSEEEFLEQQDFIFEEKRFINYFSSDSNEQSTIIEQSKYIIEHQWDKNFNECNYYLMNLKKAIQEFENDLANDYNTKGSLDRLEYAQSDLYEWVNENITLDQKCTK